MIPLRYIRRNTLRYCALRLWALSRPRMKERLIVNNEVLDKREAATWDGDRGANAVDPGGALVDVGPGLLVRDRHSTLASYSRPTAIAVVTSPRPHRKFTTKFQAAAMAGVLPTTR